MWIQDVGSREALNVGCDVGNWSGERGKGRAQVSHLSLCAGLQPTVYSGYRVTGGK